jgi:biopolymer transport protein ExbB
VLGIRLYQRYAFGLEGYVNTRRKKRMKKSSFVLVIGLFLLSFCVFAQEEEAPMEEAPVEPTTAVAAPNLGLIKGKVTDTQTPRPNNLADASITVKSGLIDEPVVASTDAAGNYEVSSLPPGEYVVTVEKPGYDESSDYVTVTPGGEAFHDVRLYKTDTLITYFWKTGPIRWPLLLCSVLGLTYIIERLVSLFKLRPRIKVEQLVSRITDALRNDNIMEAVSICEEAGGPLANVVKAGLLRYSQGMIEERPVSKEDISEAIDEASLLEIPQLERNLVVLSTIYQVSPLFGLLGTVSGMVKAFTAIALKGTGDPQLLAGGISEALLTTVIGLSIAIPVMIAYQYLVSRVDRHVLEIQQVSTEIVNALVVTGGPSQSGE